MMRMLILASGSPRRHELLGWLGLDFTVQVSDVPEERTDGEAPEGYARRLSRQKAAAVVAKIDGDALVLAADTIVVDGDDVLGKPADAASAEAMLRRLRGRTHHVITAVTLHDAAAGESRTEAVVSPVMMRDYSDAEMMAYIASGDPFDKAGGYAIQNTAFHPVENFNHCYMNVMGLPLCQVDTLLRAFGVEPPVRASVVVRERGSTCPNCT